jgi:hypothetical protein
MLSTLPPLRVHIIDKAVVRVLREDGAGGAEQAVGGVVPTLNAAVFSLAGHTADPFNTLMTRACRTVRGLVILPLIA